MNKWNIHELHNCARKAEHPSTGMTARPVIQKTHKISYSRKPTPTRETPLLDSPFHYHYDEVEHVPAVKLDEVSK